MFWHRFLYRYKGDALDEDVEMADKKKKSEEENNEKNPLINGESSSASGGSSLSTSDRIYYFGFSISYLLCFMVVLIYWGILHDAENFEGKESYKLFLAVDRHGIIFVLLLLQYAMGKIPVRFLHAVYVVVIALVFFVHTYFYYLATHKLVYNIFDWEKAPGKAFGYALGLSIASFVLQFVLFLVDMLKHKIGK